MENINERAIDELEETVLKRNLSERYLMTFVWPTNGSDIPDNAHLKLVILKGTDDLLMKDTLEMKGNTPRVNRNALFFLTPLEHEAAGFYSQLRKIIAYRNIRNDKMLNFSAEQEKEVQLELKKATDELNDSLRRYYRTVSIPTRDDFKESDLGLPTYGVSNKLDEVVYDKLRLDGEILERIDPLAIKDRYLKTDYISTAQLYQASMKIPGEARVIDQGWESGIRVGVERGLFGLGELEDGQPVCRYFKESPSSITFSRSEVIIREDICVAQKNAEKEKSPEPVYRPGGSTGTGSVNPPGPKATTRWTRQCSTEVQNSKREGVGTHGCNESTAIELRQPSN